MEKDLNFQVPAAFARRMEELYGKKGRNWLQNLPALLSEYAEHWSLVIGPPFEELSYNFVAPALLENRLEAVIKAGVPNPELLTEIEALERYAGQGAVNLLESAPDKGIMLLERARPGLPVFELHDDEKATSIAVRVMQQIWRPVPAGHRFPTVADWGAGFQRLREQFQGGTGPFPVRLVEQAEVLFAGLLQSMDEPVLLHGDLHHWNILSATRQPWLAIDPKGVVGEPVYEVGAWLRNPSDSETSGPGAARTQDRRVDQFSEAFGCERERILAWGMAQAVLSGWWSYEDHGYGWEGAFACAQLLSDLMK